MFTNTSTKKFSSIAALSFATMFALTSCSSGTADPAPAPMPSSSAMSTPTMDTAMDTELVGSACADYAKMVPEGSGSVKGMAQDPVATAASNNPMLKTLTSAVSGQLNPKVNLVDTLNGSEFTVFAPVDSAFAKIDAKTLETLKTDDKMLSDILTYHVVPGQLAPSKLAGSHMTAQGQELMVEGSGNNIMINGMSTVVCGNVKTANATVYMIDTVLMPPASDATAMKTK